MLSFKPKNITKDLLSGLDKKIRDEDSRKRTKDILLRRFGLDSSSKGETLESIGQDYGITRERVRQIENLALNSIKQSSAFESHQGVFDEMSDTIGKNRGGVASEEDILDWLSNDENERNHIYFILVLGNEFTKMKEDDTFYHRWSTDKERTDKVHEILGLIHDEIKEDDLLTEKEMLSYLKRHANDVLSEKVQDSVIASWLNLSKIIDKNALGEYGLVSSPNISPKGMRDLAFLVLRKEGSPLHFSEVAEVISKSFGKKAHPATAHNELIKDDRFVLVGRGLYALTEWGYTQGTVLDVLKNILKKGKSLSQEEIVKTVLKERYVKENTVLVNLRNSGIFKRKKSGHYTLA
jgi:hypothetical protein